MLCIKRPDIIVFAFSNSVPDMCSQLKVMEFSVTVKWIDVHEEPLAMGKSIPLYVQVNKTWTDLDKIKWENFASASFTQLRICKFRLNAAAFHAQNDITTVVFMMDEESNWTGGPV